MKHFNTDDPIVHANQEESRLQDSHVSTYDRHHGIQDSHIECRDLVRSAEIITALYKQRWQIALFFK